MRRENILYLKEVGPQVHNLSKQFLSLKNLSRNILYSGCETGCCLNSVTDLNNPNR